MIYPKEQRLIDLVKAEKVKGRRVLVFEQGTDKRDVTSCYQTLPEKEGLRATVLKSHTTGAKNRETWVKAEVREELDAPICHPRVVQTGLDPLEFPTMAYMQVEVPAFILGQASRRSWRIGQQHPVKGHTPELTGDRIRKAPCSASLPKRSSRPSLARGNSSRAAS